LPHTPEEEAQVELSVGEIEATPALKEKIKDLAETVDWGDVREISAWGALAWAAWRLFQAANLPVTEHLAGDQIAALGNRFMVLSIILIMAQIIIAMRNK
jgi:hypothetical protein